MTREEAIARGKELLGLFGGEYHEFIKMAIEALEQEPCEDAISRAYIEPIVEELENIYVNGDEYILNLLADIKNAPSVTPQYNDAEIQQPKTGHWIDDEFGSKCSSCGIHTHLNKFNRPMKFKYCSMCGAKMAESEEEK